MGVGTLGPETRTFLTGESDEHKALPRVRRTAANLGSGGPTHLFGGVPDEAMSRAQGSR
jgi:hypothetical protein